MRIAATFYTPHEAELAKGHLASEGIPSEVWDANIVAADPFLAVAVRGVKVVVPESLLVRAKAILDPVVSALSGPARPVFRVRGNRAQRGAFIGSVVGLGAGVGLGALMGAGPIVPVGLFLAGLTLGGGLGARQRADTCSDPACGERLPETATHCPKCGGLLRGDIAHGNERLAAEEALAEREGTTEPEPELADEADEDGEVDDALAEAVAKRIEHAREDA